MSGLQAIQSLLRQLNSVAVAWKQVQIIHKCMVRLCSNKTLWTLQLPFNMICECHNLLIFFIKHLTNVKTTLSPGAVGKQATRAVDFGSLLQYFHSDGSSDGAHLLRPPTAWPVPRGLLWEPVRAQPTNDSLLRQGEQYLSAEGFWKHETFSYAKRCSGNPKL